VVVRRLVGFYRVSRVHREEVGGQVGLGACVMMKMYL